MQDWAHEPVPFAFEKEVGRMGEAESTKQQCLTDLLLVGQMHE